MPTPNLHGGSREVRDLAGRPCQAWRQSLPFLLLFGLALLFFAAHATLQIADDDAAWLQGQAPTVFDRYRYLPRLAFGALHALFGPSARAALAAIFLTHVLNGWLLYRLARRLLADRLAAIAALAVFLINPLTLTALTWISCFSYVLGTGLALLALLAFLRALDAVPPRRAWAAVALISYAAGLFCSHEIFFLPVLFCLLGWQRGHWRPGAWLLGLGLGLALAVNALVYDFGRYGVESSRLATCDFALAFLSSGLASGLALVAAYPLSFFARAQGFLQLCWAEPVRWSLTAAALAAVAFAARPSAGWRLALALAGSFLALISPYLLRLYLTPDSVNYDLSYALSGRVFYPAFVALALTLGWLAADLLRRLPSRLRAWALLLPLLAYAHAFLLYDRSDFVGLNVVLGQDPALPPRWNPYAAQHPAWLLLPLGTVALALFLRLSRRAA